MRPVAPDTAAVPTAAVGLDSQLLRYLFERSRDGVAVLRADGSVAEANESFARMLGWPVPDLRRMHVWDWDAQWTREELLARLAELSTQDATFETRHRRRDGTSYDVEVSANAFELAGQTLFHCVHRDISARKRAEADLRESEERFAAIFNGSSNAMSFTVPTTGIIIDVNREWLEIMGVDRRDAIGRTGRDLGIWHSLDARNACYQIMARDGRVRNFEVEMATRTGVRPFLLSAEPVSIRDTDYVLWEFRDISDRKMAEAAQRRLQEQLIQSQKMEAVGQLAGGIAHDFNNLLQVIVGNTELARAALHGGDEPGDAIAEIEGAADRGRSLVSQLLAFSRRQIMKPQVLDLNAVVSNLITMLTRLIGENIRLSFIPGHHLGSVWADPGMIEQVVLNVCVNGRDAMGATGTLLIETGNVVLDEAFCQANPWAAPGRYTLLTITDTGCGMDQATQERIFEPFFSTKPAGKGTGLGLAVVYGIVRQHGGVVRVYSEVGLGSAFKIYLPVTERTAGRVSRVVAAPPAGGHETILVAEDEEQVRRLVTRTLKAAGYRVVTAVDGADAIAQFRERPEAFDLLLLDVVMPNVGGREVYDRARDIRPNIPALFTSGYSENAIHTDFVLKSGMNLIQKPYVGEDLLRAIRGLLDGPDEAPAIRRGDPASP